MKLLTNQTNQAVILTKFNSYLVKWHWKVHYIQSTKVAKIICLQLAVNNISFLSVSDYV